MALQRSVRKSKYGITRRRLAVDPGTFAAAILGCGRSFRREILRQLRQVGGIRFLREDKPMPSLDGGMENVADFGPAGRPLNAAISVGNIAVLVVLVMDAFRPTRGGIGTKPDNGASRRRGEFDLSVAMEHRAVISAQGCIRIEKIAEVIRSQIHKLIHAASATRGTAQYSRRSQFVGNGFVVARQVTAQRDFPKSTDICG
jgi:hypothetical protein